MIGWRRMALAALASLLPVIAEAGRVCPPASLTQPLPGVEKVDIVQASVSTARFPGLWQAGKYGRSGFDYRLFQDGSGSVAQDAKLRGWQANFVCDLAKRVCSYDNRQSPPPKAIEAARAIGDCLIATPPHPQKRPVRGTKAKPARPRSPDPKADRHVVRPAIAAPAKAVPVKVGPVKVAPVQARPPKTAAGPKPTPAAHGHGRTTAREETAAVRKRQGVTPSPKRTLATRGNVAAKAAQPIKVAHAAPARAKPRAPQDHRAKPASAPQPAQPYLSFGRQARPSPRTDALALRVTATAAAGCWLDRLADEAPPARLQRLLLLAGHDAGRIDGAPGARTLAALRAALGPTADLSATGDHIRALHAQLCAAD